MELREVWRLFRRWWWLVLLPPLVALLITLPALRDVVSPPLRYQVQVRLSAAAPPAASEQGAATPYEDSAYVPLLASEYVVANLPAWITADSFAREVSENLAGRGVEIQPGDLAGAFAADGFRGILTLYATWDNPDELRAIAEAAVEVLQTRNQNYFAAFAAQPVEVVPLDDIEVARLAPPITQRLMPLLRIAIGVAGGLLLAALAAALDRSLYDRAEVEALGVPVLGEIPRER